MNLVQGGHALCCQAEARLQGEFGMGVLWTPAPGAEPTRGTHVNPSGGTSGPTPTPNASRPLAVLWSLRGNMGSRGQPSLCPGRRKDRAVVGCSVLQRGTKFSREVCPGLALEVGVRVG